MIIICIACATIWSKVASYVMNRQFSGPQTVAAMEWCCELCNELSLLTTRHAGHLPRLWHLPLAGLSSILSFSVLRMLVVTLDSYVPFSILPWYLSVLPTMYIREKSEITWWKLWQCSDFLTLSRASSRGSSTPVHQTLRVCGYTTAASDRWFVVNSQRSVNSLFLWPLQCCFSLMFGLLV